MLHCRLTYKYSRLVDEAHYKDGELPASEKCTLDEGEEEDEVYKHVRFIIESVLYFVLIYPRVTQDMQCN